MTDKVQSDAAKARTAAALRENLRKRKAAARKAKTGVSAPKDAAGNKL